jgi:hypothetical protein
MALTCRIELSKTNGVTVTVEDAQAQTSQTIVIDGKSLVFTCKDQQNTSTVTQKSDSIELKCKTFTIDAETVTVKSSKDSSYESGAKLSMTSKSDFSIAAETNVSAAANQDLKISGATVSGEGQQKASLKAAEIAITADAKAELKSKSVEVAADLAMDVKGTTVKVTSNGTLSVEGMATTVKGQMVNVQAPMIKLG